MPPVIYHADPIGWTLDTSLFGGFYTTAIVSQLLAWGRSGKVIARNTYLGADLGIFGVAPRTKLGLSGWFSCGGTYSGVPIHVYSETAHGIASFPSGLTAQFFLWVNGTGQIEVRGGQSGTLLATSTRSLKLGTAGAGGTFQFVESICDISTGFIRVQVDGVDFFGTSGLTGLALHNTTLGSNIGYYQWIAGAAHLGGEMIVHDGTSLLGERAVLLQSAAGAGTYQQASPSAGTQASCVGEALANGDTDYIDYDVTVPKTSTFTVDPLPLAVVSIDAVIPWAIGKKTDAGANKGRSIIISGATLDDGGTDISVTTSYGPLPRVQPVDPDTGVAWTRAGFNASEFGWRRVA